MKKYIYFFLTLFIFYSFCSVKGSEVNSNINVYLENVAEKANIPGIAVIVVNENNETSDYYYGYADLENKVKVNRDTIFELSSNSKSFTALAFYQLINEYGINVNDSIYKYIPNITFYYENEKVDITIANFLNHSSGIPFNSIELIPESSSKNALQNTVYLLDNIQLVSLPGTHFQYATINYDVIGYLIEIISGKTYEEYLQEKVLNPLKLTNTGTISKGNVEIAKGYSRFFSQTINYNAPSYYGNIPAGYITSNITDCGLWLAYHLNKDDQLLGLYYDEKDYSFMFNQDEYYSNGWFGNNKMNRISHGGNNPNYSSYFIVNHENGFGIAVLCNINTTYTQLIAESIERILLNTEASDEIFDIYLVIDKLASYVCIVLLMTFSIILLKLSKFYKKNIRRRTKKSIKLLFVLLLIIIVYIILNKIINMLPALMYNGVSWNFIKVWLPQSVIGFYYLIKINIVCILLYIALALLYEKKEEL